MIDPTALRTLCEQATNGEADWNESWNYFSEELLGECNVRFDVAHLRALLDENSALRHEVEEARGDYMALVPVFRRMAEKVGLEPRSYAEIDNPANITLNIAERAIVNRLRAESAEASLARLRSAGAKVVAEIEGFDSALVWDSPALDAFKAEINKEGV